MTVDELKMIVKCMEDNHLKADPTYDDYSSLTENDKVVEYVSYRLINKSLTSQHLFFSEIVLHEVRVCVYD